VRFQKDEDGAPLSFEHYVDNISGGVSFAFTYPYSYTMVQNDLNAYNDHVNEMSSKDAIFYQRELLTNTPDNLRVDLITISSVDGASSESEPILPDLFPDNISSNITLRPPIFPNKEIIFISARVHPGEVPAQHTFAGILDLLMDPNDLCAKELRRRYVFKLIPILNPDGKYHK
jgi:cytosolic carboxypeptidase protein 5